MPTIKEYGQEVQAANPALDISARPIQEAGQLGRAVQRFGAVVSDVGEAVYKRQAQEEQDNAQVDAAANRAEMSADIDSQIKSGNVSVEGTLERYSQKVDTQSDNYQTRAGRRMFNRQAEINRAMIFRTASDAQSHLAGENAKLAQQDILRHDTLTVENNPTAYAEVVHARIDAIDQQVLDGNLNSTTATQLKTLHGKELAQAAVRGWAKNIEDNGNGPEIADAMLNGTKENDHKGAFDEVLDSDSKSQLNHMINAYKSAREVDANRVDRLEKKAQEKKADAWRVANFGRLENNELTAKEVVIAVQNKILSPQEGEHQLSMIDRNVKQSSKTDHALLNDLTSRIYLSPDDPNKIDSVRQIDEWAAKGLLTITDRNRLAKAIDTTDEGKNLKSNKKVLIDYMKSQLVKTDKSLGIQDPEGEKNFASAFQNLQALEDQYRQENKPVSSLYDPLSKDSFYNRALAFKKSPREIIRSTTDRMRAQTSADKAGAQADKTKVVLPRTTESGEKLSPEEWMKRRKGTK